MDPIRTIILLLALFTVFIAGGLFFRDHSLKNRSIAIFTFLFGIEMFCFLFGTSAVYDLYPQLVGRYYFSAGVLYGPLLFFHFRSVIHNAPHKWSWSDLIHLLPLIFLNLWMVDLIFMPGADRIGYYNSSDNFFGFIIYLNYFRGIVQLVYGILILTLFYKERKQLDIDTRFYLGAMAIIYFSITVVISFLTLYARSWRDFSLYYLLSTIIIMLMAYVLYRDPKTFQQLKKKYAHSHVDKEELRRISRRIDLLFRDEKVFLDRRLTIDSLAVSLDSKSHYLSQTFTNEIKESFNAYVNRHRIEYAKNLLLDEAYGHLKIDAIAEKSGFNNKVTFYKAFSLFTDTTPSKYRKNGS